MGVHVLNVLFCMPPKVGLGMRIEILIIPPPSTSNIQIESNRVHNAALQMIPTTSAPSTVGVASGDL